MITYIFDLETDGFLNELTKIHCMSILDYENDKVYEYNVEADNIKEGLARLQKADRLVAHNGLDFDIRAIKKLYPKWTTEAEIYDTLIACKYAFPDIKERDFVRLRKVIAKPRSLRTEADKEQLKMIGRHSLKAYGLRLGEHKGSFGEEVGFHTYSPEMQKYCTQDITVNAKLYHKLLSLGLDEDVLRVEFEAKRICLEQTSFGFRFDIAKANKLKEKLEQEQKKLQDEIKSKLGGPFVIPLEVKVPTRSVNYKDVLRGCEVKGCPYTKIKIKAFNPTSRHDLTSRLIERFGWKPKEFGADGKPTLSDAVLASFKGDIFKTIADSFMIQKRLGMLSEGKNSWMGYYNEETKAIHGSIDTLGTGTHRCTHSRPNLGQIPSTRSPYGKECRELFKVQEGWKLFGTDAAGLELRMLAHYMSLYDKGDYAKIILEGDIHTANQEAAGLPTRNNAKTFIYAFLYGAGDEKIGSIIGGSRKAGKDIKKKFFAATPAMKILTDNVKDAAEARGFVRSLDGRRIPVRSAHSALNFLLQSSGAIVCKYWMVNLHKELSKHGYVSGIDFKQSAYVHDELQIAFNPESISGETLGKIAQDSIRKVGELLNVRIPLDSDWSVGDTYAETH